MKSSFAANTTAWRRCMMLLCVVASFSFGQVPTFVARPLSQAVVAGQAVTIHALATGGAPLAYQWKRNSQVIAGASSATLSIARAALSDRGAYQVIVGNAEGSATSVFMLEVGPPTSSLVSWGTESVLPAATTGNLIALKAAPGGGHFLGLRADRSVTAWGQNSTNQLNVPTGLASVVGIAATLYGSVALKDDGKLVGWGYSAMPLPSGLAGVVAISGGNNHVLALKADGTVVAWGDNSFQQSRVPTTLRKVVGISAGGGHSLALLADGTVVAWGMESGTRIPAGLSGVIAVSAGDTHSLALRSDGTVVAWGTDYANSTVVPAGLAGVVAISAGGSHNLALKEDGTVVAWGRPYENQTKIPEGLSGAFGVAAASMRSTALITNVAPTIRTPPRAQVSVVGDYVTLSVTATGTVPMSYVWKRSDSTVTNGGRISGATTSTLVIDGITAADAGNYAVEVSNAYGVTVSAAAAVTVNIPPTFVSRPHSRLAKIGEPVTFTVVAADPGQISYRWKRNGQVVPGAFGASLTLPAVRAADRGFYEVIVANSTASASSFFRVETTTLSTADTFVMAWGGPADDYGQLRPPAGLSDIVAVAPGKRHAAALRANGTVVVWGYSNASLGMPPDLEDVIAVAVSEGATLAVRADGRVVKWGAEHPSYTVSIPPGLRGIVDLAARENTVVLLKSDGSVASLSGLAPPPGLGQVVAIATGLSHHLALRSDGTVAAWGNPSTNSQGQATAPDGLTGVVAIGAGDNHSMALKSDGSVIAWGAITQQAVPKSLSQLVALDGGRFHSAALRADGTVVAWGDTTVRKVYQETPRVGGIIALGTHSGYHLAVAAPVEPTFVQSPASRAVNQGESVTLSARSISAPMASLQWHKNGAPIFGATDASWTLATPQAHDSGSYTLVATTSQGTFTSAEATLSVVAPLPVVTRPRSRLVAAGEPTTFVFEAVGALSYQWRRNGETIAGETTGTLALTSVTMADRGYYEAVATGAGGATARAVVQLNVAAGPTYLQGWNSDTPQQFRAPGNVRNAVLITGTDAAGGALRADGTVVTWGNFSPGTPPAGLNSVVSLATGSGHGIALNGGGSVLVFGGAGYGETNVPAGLGNVVAVAASAHNSLALRGDGTVVRWGHDSYGTHAVPAGLSHVVAIAAGDHHSLALKSDGTVVVWGSVSSGSLTPPVPLTDVVSISASGSSSGAVRRDGSCVVWGGVDAAPAGIGPVHALSIGNYDALALKPDGTLAAWGRAGFPPPVLPAGLARVVALSAAGGVGLALVEGIPAAPTVVSAPSSQSVDYGTNAVFTVGAAGTPVLSYEWRRVDQPTFSVGATGIRSPTLTLANVQSTDSGTYSVIVTNSFGSVAVENVVLNVTTRTVTPSGPAVVGGSVTLSVNAADATGYQWRYRGTPIAGATSATLPLANLSRGNNGAYDVVLSFAARTVVSHSHTLDVRPATAADFYRADPEFAPRFEQSGAGGILAALPLPDGKFLVGGDFTRLGAHPAVYLARVQADGKVDPTYTPPPISGPVRALLRQADGHILVGGDFAYANGRRSGGLFRLGLDLAVDPTFDPGQGFDAPVLALAQQADGKIIVGGEFSRLGDTSANRIVRLNANGSHDPEFTFANRIGPVRVIRIQFDGRILIGGGQFSDGRTEVDGFLQRLLATGNTDPEWSEVYRPSAPVLAILPQTHGGWLVAGAFSAIQNFNGYSGYIVRLDDDGAHDTSFALDPSLRMNVREISTLADAGGGKYLVAGDGLAPVRLNSSGVADATQPTETLVQPRIAVVTRDSASGLRLWGRFGETNVVTGSAVLSADGATFGAVSGEVPRAVAEVLQAQQVGGNRVLVRGTFTHVNDVPRTALARLSADGSVDPGFVPGVAFAPVDSGRFALQGDGRILAHTGAALVRLEPDGALDPSWVPLSYWPGDLALDRDGRALVAARGANNGLATGPVIRRLGATGALDPSLELPHQGLVQDITVQSNGRILLGGLFSITDGAQTISPPARLLPSGALDSSFRGSFSNGCQIVPGPFDWVYLISSDWTSGSISRLEGDRYSTTAAFDYRTSGITFGRAAALLPLPDGKFLRSSTGSADTFNQPAWLLGRHLAGGELDPTFQVDGLDRLRTRATRLLLADDASVWLFGQHLAAFGAPRFGAMRLAVAAPAAIATPPVAVQALPGDSATFSVIATGTGPLAYQWFRDGSPLPGATRATLTLTGLSLRDVAGYSVRVANSFNTVTSAPAQLRGPNPPPTIATQPASQLAVVANPVTFSVSASGSGPLIYQWRRSGHPLPGATNAQLTLERPARTDAGFYDVLVGDGLSAVVSDVAQLDVAPSSYPNQLTFDPSFAPRFETAGGNVHAIVPAPEGRFYVSGDFSRINGVARPGLARLESNLQVDPAFMPPTQLADTTSSFAAIAGVRVQAVLPDGKVLVTQPLPSVGEYPFRNQLVRLLADGSIDPAFTASTEPQNIVGLAVQPDGRIVVYGLAVSVPLPAGKRYVYRLNADGSLDPSYAPIFRTSSSEATAPTGLVVQPDGRAIFYGSFESIDGQIKPGLVRLTTAGTVDASFPAGSAISIYPAAVALQSDGRLLIGGGFTIQGNSQAVLARFSTAGEFESVLLTRHSMNGTIRRILPLADGRIWVVSREPSVGSTPATMVRVDATGAVERTATTWVTGVEWSVAAVDADRLLVTATPEPAIGIVRIGANGSPDGPVARLETPVGVQSLLPGPGGKYYVTGYFNRINGVPQSSLARLNADGSLDPTFSTGTGFNTPPTYVSVMADGRLLASGGFSSYRSLPVRATISLRTDGSLDPTFTAEAETNGVAPSGWPRQLADGRIYLGENVVLLADGTRDRKFQNNAGSAAGNPALRDRGLLVVARSDISSNWIVSRLRSDGTVAATGIVKAQVLSALVPLATGKILAGGGNPLLPTGQPTQLSRLHADLTPDGNFQFSGAPLPASNTNIYLGPQLLVQEDGRVILNDYYRFGRVLANGGWDSSFVLPAATVKMSPADRSGVRAIWMQDDGSLLLGDENLTVDGFKRRGVVRFVDRAAAVLGNRPADATLVAGDALALSIAATGPGNLAYRWLRNGVAIPGATAATFHLASVGIGDAGNYSVQVTNANGTVRSAAGIVRIDPAVAPALVRQPQGQSVAAGQSVRLAALASGAPAPTYQWFKDGTALQGQTHATLLLAAMAADHVGVYTVEAVNRAGRAVSEPARLSLLLSGIVAAHEWSAAPAPGRVTVRNTLSYPGTPGVSWQVLLPPLWTYRSGPLAPGLQSPAAGTGNLLEFRWNAAPAGQLSFTYELDAPTEPAGQAELVALVGVSITAETTELLARPDPLIVRRRHSADTDGDLSLSLAELMRVIQLYNTRAGPVRTGCYAPDASNAEDGFAPERNRTAAQSVTLTRYHSADTRGVGGGAAPDGAIDLVELTRVIELYNSRTGSVRTGRYRLQGGTEDGFTADP